MHDALTIAVPTLAVVFAALLNRSDLQSFRGEFQTFRAETREEFQAVRAEFREEFQAIRAEFHEDQRELRAESVAIRERLARIEERIGIKSAAS
jgi:hypothetical protein